MAPGFGGASAARVLGVRKTVPHDRDDEILCSTLESSFATWYRSGRRVPGAGGLTTCGRERIRLYEYIADQRLIINIIARRSGGLPAMIRTVSKLAERLRQRGMTQTVRLAGEVVAYEVGAILDRRFDRAYGTETSERVPLENLSVEHESRAYEERYQPITARYFRRMLGATRMRYEDFVFVDLGAGKGRAVMLAARERFKKVVGVEFSRELCAVAERNAARFARVQPGCAPIEIVCADAAEYDLPNEPLVIFMYNPFGAPVMTRVLERVRAWMNANHHALWVLYRNPVCHDRIEATGLFQVIVKAPTHCVYARRVRPPRFPSRPSLRWETMDGEEAIARLAPAWDALAASSELPLLSDSAWTLAYRDAFLPDRSLLKVHALWAGSHLCAVVPMLAPRPLHPRAWVAMENEHNPYWSMAFDPAVPGAAEAVLSSLLERGDYVYFRRLHLHGELASSCLQAAASLGLRTSLIESEKGDSVLPLSSSWDAFRSQVSKAMIKDAVRQAKRLGSMGALRMDVLTAWEPMAPALEECFRLETLGWKGVSGSPIVADPQTQTFYTDLARRKASSGQMALYLLRLGDRLLAFEYCLRGGGRIELLKISYDPEYKVYSPGNVLRMLVIQHEIERGEVRTYHLGRPSEWKARWTVSVAPLCTLRIYGKGLRAQGAYFAGPRLRSALKTSRSVGAVRQVLEQGRLGEHAREAVSTLLGKAK